MAGRLVSDQVDRRPLRAQGRGVPQLDHRRRQRRSDRHRRLQVRSRPLPPLCQPRLPLGAPHADHADVERARSQDLGVGGALADDRSRLDLRRWPGVVPDTVNHAKFLHGIYTAADPHYTGRATVPVLWDKHRRTIVNNESSEIIRMLNSEFDEVGARPGDYYPQALRADIDAVNARIYDTLNNGAYKAGFATTQAAYEKAVLPLFETLDWLEQRLADRRFLFGNNLTEADIRLFTTLIRFDAVYVGHFKCNIRRLVDYRNLSAYARDIYQSPGVAATVNFEHIRRHYYESYRSINPSGIVPAGPVLDFTSPHGCERLAVALLAQ